MPANHRMKSKRRLLVIEHDPLAARGLRDVLKRFPNFTAIFVDGVDLESGLRLLEEMRPEVMLLSIGNVTAGAVAFIRKVKNRYPDLALIVIAGDDRLVWVSAVLKAGADSYLHKGIASASFDMGLSRSLDGEQLAVVPDPSSWLSRIVNMRRKTSNHTPRAGSSRV